MPPYQSNTPLDENLIIFMSIPDFSSSSLAFWEYIQENTSFETVWIVRRDDIFERLLADGIKCCLITNYVESAEWFSKAKYVVCADNPINLFPKPIGQITLGFLRYSMGLLQDVFTVTPMNDFILKATSFYKAISTSTDIFPVSSEFQRAVNSAICYIDPRKTVITGMPRLDCVIQSNGKNELLKAMPELQAYKTIVFYCPSLKKWSGLDLGAAFDENIFNLKDFTQKSFEELLEVNNAAIIFKMHPADEIYFSQSEKKFLFPKHCFMIDSYTFWPKTLYHVLNAFDIMITENSSLANEFLLLDRPIIFNHQEVDLIFNNFKPIIDDTDIMFPGQIFKTFSEFCNALQNAINYPKEYHEKRMKAKQLFHKYTDGKSCERIYELMRNFTPISNLDYEMFTRPLKEELTTVMAQHEERIADMQNQIIQLECVKEEIKKEYVELENSRTVRYARLIIKWVCPPDSIRRKLVIKLIKLVR